MPITNDLMAKRRAEAHQRRGRRVVYKMFSAKSINFATGSTGSTYTSRYVDHALVWELTHETIIASNGRYRLRDKACSILTTQMPETPPSKESRIVIDSIEYMIVDWKESGDNAKFVFVLRVP